MKRLLVALAVLVLLAAACAEGEPRSDTSASPTEQATASASAESSSSPSAKPAKGIFKLDHLMFIVMENRSFDHYFGTYPGADGIPMKNGKPSACIPHPVLGHCVRPYHDTNMVNVGGPHGKPQSDMDIDGGKMDGFIRAALLQASNVCAAHPTDDSCKGRVGPQLQPQVMGYHTGAEVKNYWTYADNFVLHDHMFAPVDSWTLPSHLFLVSGWSAYCKNHREPMSCRSEIYNSLEKAKRDEVPYAWTDITYLLHENDVSWAYYVDEGTCWTSECAGQKQGTPNAMNPMPGFQTVHEDGQIGNIREYPAYFDAATAGTLPSVSWIMPGRGFSEHPNSGSIASGIAFVTKVVNAAMEGPDWNQMAIFVTWDDWGGFYDHVNPPRVDENGYGIRVPSLLISPYAKTGFVDHQVLSFDAYLKLIEDRFLDGQRLDPKTDGRPDARPTVREEVKILGDLKKDFDFTLDPRPPLILDPSQKEPPG